MKKMMWMAALAACGGCLMFERGRPAGSEYVDAFDLSAASCGQGKKLLAKKSVDGHPLTLAGKVYSHPHQRQGDGFRRRGGT